MSDQRKYLLDEEHMPESWYNIVPDLPEPPPPPLDPETKEPIGPDDLSPIFPMSLIEQEMSQDSEIEIPQPIRDVYALWRPTPLFRARSLEEHLETPAKLFYKYEGVSPSGSHKPNTAVAQAWYNQQAGIETITTETGAGQWGSALAFAGSQFDVDIEVFMVRVSYDQKPYRKSFMEAMGATCTPSPSDKTESGRAILEKDPDTTGSLGIAISEAVELAVRDDKTKYSLGSVLNHVLMHQTVIGREAIAQMEKADAYPDVIVAPAGGGSNFAGLAFPFIGNQLQGGREVRVVACEPAACPTMTRGEYAYDFGDTGHLTPLMKMHTLGSEFIPPGFHAGGLRYHGMGPLISHLLENDLIEAKAHHQNPCFEAGLTFAQTEGVIPAPEANHGIRGAIEEALRCKEEGSSETILFNMCGHGNFDMSAYDDYLAGRLDDRHYDEDKLEQSLSRLPVVE